MIAHYLCLVCSTWNLIGWNNIFYSFLYHITTPWESQNTTFVLLASNSILMYRKKFTAKKLKGWRVSVTRSSSKFYMHGWLSDQRTHRLSQWSRDRCLLVHIQWLEWPKGMVNSSKQERWAKNFSEIPFLFLKPIFCYLYHKWAGNERSVSMLSNWEVCG